MHETFSSRPLSRRHFFALAGAGAGALALAGCGTNAEPEFEIVEVQKVFTCASYDGGKLFGIDLSIRNNGDGTVSGAVVASLCPAEQAGEKLAASVVPAGAYPDLAGDDEVASGDEGVIELVWDLANGDDLVDVKLDIDTVDGRGKAVVLEQSFNLADAEAVVSEAGFTATIDGCRILAGEGGVSLLAVSASWTNESDATESFGMLCEPKAFQNGTELSEGDVPLEDALWDDASHTDNLYADVQPGAGLPVALVYELQDLAAPVEVQLIDFMSYDQRAVVQEEVDVAALAAGDDASSDAAVA